MQEMRGCFMRKTYRVKKEADFQKVFHNGVSTANRQFVIYVLEKKSKLILEWGCPLEKKLEMQ